MHQFIHPTSDITTITQVVTSLAEQLYQENVNYYKVGVGLLDLIDERYAQDDLFNAKPDNRKLMQVYDAINHRYGAGTLFLAAQGTTPNKWNMRRQFLTPQYTTKWADLPKINC